MWVISRKAMVSTISLLTLPGGQSEMQSQWGPFEVASWKNWHCLLCGRLAVGRQLLSPQRQELNRKSALQAFADDSTASGMTIGNI